MVAFTGTFSIILIGNSNTSAKIFICPNSSEPPQGSDEYDIWAHLTYPTERSLFNENTDFFILGGEQIYSSTHFPKTHSV